MVDPKVIEKIKKLLRLAVDQVGKPEGDLASQRAQEAMCAHGITVDLEDQAVDISSIEVGCQAWKRTILGAASILTGCFATYTPGSSEMRVFGREIDRELCEYFYESFTHQCRRDTNRYKRESWPKPSMSELNSFRMSWAFALTHKVERVAAQQRGSAEGTWALVPANRTDKARAFAESLFNIGKSGTVTFNHSKEGYDLGQQASLARGIEEPSKPKLLENSERRSQ